MRQALALVFNKRNLGSYTVFGVGAGLMLSIITWLKFRWFFTNDYPNLFLTVIGFLFILIGVFIGIRMFATGQKPSHHNPVDMLSKREAEVFRMLLEDKSNKEIACGLFIENSTLKTHINNIYRKLEVSDRRELILKFTNGF